MEAPRIFIVEDDALIVAHLQQILQEFNYGIAGIAASGADAIEQIEKTNPQLILMDIRIRGPINGLEAAHRISKKQNIPIIFLTAHANQDYLKQAQLDNVYSYLIKPVRSIDLHTNIQMALFKHQVQQRLNMVNSILKTRQQINQFILERRSKKELLNGICQMLAGTDVFTTTILLTGTHNETMEIFISRDYEQDGKVLKQQILENNTPPCIQNAFDTDEVVITRVAEDQCILCKFCKSVAGQFHLSYRLGYRDTQYGVLTAYLAPAFEADDQIVELFKEIGDDIAYAIHKFDIEQMQLKAQKMLKESEYKYRILSENALVGVFLVQNEQFKYANPRMAEIFQYESPKKILQLKSYLDLCHPANHQKIKAVFKELLESHSSPTHIEFSGMDKDGRRLELELLASRIEFQGKEAILGSILDITEKKEKDELIRVLSTGIQESPVGIMVTDPEGKIEYVNPAFTKISGYTEKDVKGKTPRLLKSGEMPEEFYRLMWKTISGGSPWHDEIINRKKDGSFYWAKLLIVPIKDANNRITHFMGIQEDISENKKLQQQLLQSQKMEAIGRLAGGIAHDFNNLLTVINGYAQLLLYSLKEDNVHRKKVEQIFQAGEKAKNLTSQLLAFSRKQMRQARILNLNDVIENYLPMLKSLLGENITLDIQLASDLWPIESDAHQLEQILLNLIVNAKQAMPDGGKLTIITQNCAIDQKFASENEGARPGDFVRLSVADTGVGMDQETLKHIFEPFFTTRGVGEGTGLGLSTVYGIVKQNEGMIYVTSAPQSGTIFDIYFPKVEGTEQASRPEDKEEQQNLRGDASILLVEDDADVRKLTGKALSYFGYKVTPARDGKDALRKLKADRQAFDLLITDLVMPNLSGKKLAAMIHEKYPDLPVLFISGYSENEFKDENRNDQPNFLQKPFSPIDLAKKVNKLLKDRNGVR
ncbi:response regulator [Calditrichota bacterium GD2]